MICIENCHLLKFVHFQGTYQTETTHTIIMSYCVNLSWCDFYQRINKLLKPILKSVYIAVGYINQKMSACIFVIQKNLNYMIFLVIHSLSLRNTDYKKNNY